MCLQNKINNFVQKYAVFFIFSKEVKLKKKIVYNYVCLFIRVLNSHFHTSDSETVTASAAAFSMLYSSQMFLVLVKNENGKQHACNILSYIR